MTGLNTTALVEEQQETQISETKHKKNDFFKKPATLSQDAIPKENVQSKVSSSLDIPNQSKTDMEQIDEKVKSIMERGANTIPAGTAHGKPKQAISWICKLCGKEGRSHVIRDHIETNHLEGICLPCDLCNKTFSARGNLKKHKYSLHAKQDPTDLAKEQEQTIHENKDEPKKATKHQINQDMKANALLTHL